MSVTVITEHGEFSGADIREASKLANAARKAAEKAARKRRKDRAAIVNTVQELAGRAADAGFTDLFTALSDIYLREPTPGASPPAEARLTELAERVRVEPILDAFAPTPDCDPSYRAAYDAATLNR